MKTTKTYKVRTGNKHSQSTLHKFFSKVKDSSVPTGCNLNNDIKLVNESVQSSSDFINDPNIEQSEKCLLKPEIIVTSRIVSTDGLNFPVTFSDNEQDIFKGNMLQTYRSIEFSPEKRVVKKKRVPETCVSTSTLDKSDILIFPHDNDGNIFSDISSGDQMTEKVNFIKTLLSPIKNSENERRKVANLSLRSPSKRNEIQHILSDGFDSNINDIKNNALDGLFDDEWIEELQEEKLDLSTFTYCTIQKCCKADNEIRLDLQGYTKATCMTQYTVCLLKGYWIYGSYDVNDVISVQAKYDNVGKLWTIDDDFGFIVRYPDRLISSTTVVSACSCLRRAVISNIYPIYGLSNPLLLIGTLMHELLQEVLRRKVTTLSDIQKIANDMIRNRRVMISLYEVDASISYLQKEVNQFTLNIYSFVNTYLTSSQSVDRKKSWPGKISQICDIEENIWAPSLGIKGTVDVTVAVKSDNMLGKIMPLEVKTGRVTKSTEHRGQLMLYMLMMWEQKRDVDSGLLLYLRGNTLEEIKMSHRECTGLIALRNELVSYIVNNLPADTNFILPQPVNEEFACSRCQYITLCSASLVEEDFSTMSNTCSNLMKSSISHLSRKHIEYVFHWTKLLKMENTEVIKEPYSGLSSIWRLSPEERQTKGFSIAAYLSGEVQKKSDKLLLHRMVSDRTSDKEIDFTRQRLLRGDFIIISTEKQYALCFGTIIDISKSQIELLLYRDLSYVEEGTKFYIDLYSSGASVSSVISSLQLLLTDSPNAGFLRSSIIDMNLPDFLPRVNNDIIAVGSEILKNLNSSQKRAIFRVLSSSHYTLIKGMPGTGKTDTIAALVQYLVMLKQTVIITSHTHSAVDNVLLKLRGKVNFLRLASPFKVHPDIKVYCEEIVLENCVINSVEDVEAAYNVPVVGITCMGCIRHILLKKRIFDYCIVDEAAQVLQPMTLAALIAANKFVLVGDPDQLPPLVINKQANSLGLGESLFKKLDRPAVTSLLHLQYRMNEEIMRVANQFTYKGLLASGTDAVKSGTIPEITNTPICQEYSWLQKALSSNLKDSVIFINIRFFNKMEENVQQNSNCTKYTNEDEVNIVVTIVNALKQGGIDESSVGVIAPYTRQVTLLKQTFSENNISIEVNTVDQYQGRDKEIILYSCTRSIESKEGDILSDKRRLTVAITRAKRKLIMIGDMSILKSYSTFTTLFSCILPENIIDI